MAASQASGLHSHAGASSATLNNLYNSGSGALNSVVNDSGSSSGGTNSGFSGNGIPDDLAPLLKEKKDAAGNPIPIDPRVTVLTVGKMANKFFAEAQQKERAGKYSEAEVLYMRAIRLRNRFWGDSDPAVLKMYMLIGKIEMK
jgi:hypothetical protein